MLLRKDGKGRGNPCVQICSKFSGFDFVVGVVGRGREHYLCSTIQQFYSSELSSVNKHRSDMNTTMY